MVYHYCSPVPRMIAERRVWALRLCSGGRGHTGEKKKDCLRADIHTRSVWWLAPLRASALKEQFL